MIRRLLLLLFALLGPLAGRAVDRTSADFVKASLLAIGPGEQLYSCAGHACFRMECPTYELDYCFSYESESVTNRVWEFLAGRLKMGMFAIPTAEFLKEYARDGREVLQYELNLSATAKQRLWKILDVKVAEGADLSYDFVRRGCAQSTLQYLFEAVRPAHVEQSPWTPKYDKTMRELFVDALKASPWNLIALQAIVGTDVDADLPKLRRVIIPGDLVEFLRGTAVDGTPILKGEPEILQPQTRELRRPLFTPMVAACLALVLAVAGWFACGRMIDFLFLSFQAVFGLFLVYLVFCSPLPATTWNWLLVPFNPLPLVLWKWRRACALPFAAVTVLWIGFIVLWPHMLTGGPYVVLAAAYVVRYMKYEAISKPST